MVHFSCAPKKVTRLMLLSILIYMSLWLILTVTHTSPIGTREHVDVASQIQKVACDHSMLSAHVDIKNVYPSDNGKVKLMLSLDRNDLMKLLNGSDLILDNNTGIGAEATNNPLPHDVTWLIHNPDFCTGQPGLQYLIYVHSAPTNRVRRYNLRSTWAQGNMFKDNRTKLLFVLGQPDSRAGQKELEVEMSKYGDILQGDFVDHYQNLTYKGLLALKWVSTHCQKAKYAIKADDDAFDQHFQSPGDPGTEPAP